MNRPTLFVSYSHKDEKWKERIVSQLKTMGLEPQVDCWDDRRIQGGDDWYARIVEALSAASLALLLVTEDFLSSRFIKDEEVPRLLDRHRRDGLRIYPIVVSRCDWKSVDWLRRLNLRPPDGRPLSASDDGQIRADLAGICKEIVELVERVPYVPPAHVRLRPDLVELGRLPRAGRDFFGRQAELQRLDAAWDDVHGTNVISVVAWAGVGKSALVQHWLERLGSNFGGARRGFGWSVFRQGVRGPVVSADEFIDAALRWFGDPDASAGSAWEKGVRLSHLIRRDRALLLLDGLEPLQSLHGRIRESAMGVAALLRELAAENPGLCMITTRLLVLDIEQQRRSTAPVLDLNHLSEADGALLLDALGVHGSEAERRAASREFEGHALTLNLLGTFLCKACHGDIHRRHEVHLIDSARRLGSHAERVMASYEAWFADTTELAVLRMVGLFDRPAVKEWVAVLGAPPAIPHLTGPLQRLDEIDWQLAVSTLRDARLLLEAAPGDPDTLDCHPLVRDYFGQHLRERFPEAWLHAHDRLYQHLKSVAKALPALPGSLEEMAPLFAAVVHGCYAGRHQEALNDIYKSLIQRGDQHFCRVELRAAAADLVTVSNFCSPYSSEPLPELPSRERAYVSNQLAPCYWILGELDKAASCLQSALRTYVEEKARPEGSGVARDFAELSVVRGLLKDALAYGERSIDLADSPFAKIRALATCAMVLHQAGRWRDAIAQFRLARRMQKTSIPEQPILPFVHGYYYGDLMLDLNKARAVIRQAELVLNGVSVGYARALEVPLTQLLLGRAHALLAPAHRGGEPDHLATAQKLLDDAVEGLRRAGDQSHLARGLIGRAQLWRTEDKLDLAEQDLSEALDTVQRYSMKLLQIDCNLEWAFVLHARNLRDRSDTALLEARRTLAEARALIEATGYRRRERQLIELQRLLGAP